MPPCARSFTRSPGLPAADLGRPEAPAALEANGLQPELRSVVITLNVHVAGFPAIAGVEEEPVRPRPQHSRRCCSLYRRRSTCVSSLDCARNDADSGLQQLHCDVAQPQRYDDFFQTMHPWVWPPM